MTIINVQEGYAAGVSWTIDLDNSAGTIGFIMTGGFEESANLTVQFTVVSGTSTLGTYGPTVMNTLLGEARTVLVTNTALEGLTLPTVTKPSTPPISVETVWTCQPTGG